MNIPFQCIQKAMLMIFNCGHGDVAEVDYIF